MNTHKVAVENMQAPRVLKAGKIPRELLAFNEKAKKNSMHTKGGYERWWNSIPGDSSLVVEYKPPTSDCHLYVDDLTGRFVVSYKVVDQLPPKLIPHLTTQGSNGLR